MAKHKKISDRIEGSSHGPIMRLIDPGYLGEKLKPFIFLDFFNAEIQPGFGFPMHPHSGIATLTWQPGCDVSYQDTTGQKGILKAGGLEWMNSGGGAWHQGLLMGSGHVTGFQLWVPMPPMIEEGASQGMYIAPEEVPSSVIPGGTIQLFLGQLEQNQVSLTSNIASDQDMNYFVITLKEGEAWSYSPPQRHDVTWAFSFEGLSQVQDIISDKELLIFEGEGVIDFKATLGTSHILVGSAKKHAHRLVSGQSSVHTSEAALEKGIQKIKEIGAQIRKSKSFF